MNKPTLLIETEFEGQIWKLMPDAMSAILALEIRNAENHTVQFTAVDLKTGATHFKDLRIAEPWLAGLEAVYNGVLFVHGYQSPGSPIHKGITAISLLKGEQIWNNYNDSIDHMSVNGPVTYNTQLQPRRLYLTEVLTGTKLKPYNPVADQELLLTIKLPSLMPCLPAGLQTDCYNMEITGPVHYLAYNNFRIVSLHALQSGSLQQMLFIYDDQGLVFEDIMNIAIQKLQPEAFVMHNNQLIWIKNRSILKVLNL